MLSKEELEKPYVKSGIPSAEIYREVWTLIREGKRKPNADRTNYFSIGDYIEEQLRNIPRINGDYSHIGMKIKEYLSQNEVASGAILSVGCSIANDLKAMAQLYPDANLVGIDIGLEALSRAKKNNENNKSAELICAASSHLPFRASIFDTIITGHLFDSFNEWNMSGQTIDTTSKENVRGINEVKQTFQEIRMCSKAKSIWYATSVSLEFLKELFEKYGKSKWVVVKEDVYSSNIVDGFFDEETGFYGGSGFVVANNIK